MHVSVLVSFLLSAPPATDAGVIRPSMQAALSAVVGLSPLLASPTAFRDPANAARIRGGLDVLTPLEHFFKKDQAAVGPNASAVASLFAREVGQARAEFDSGETEAARLRMRAVSSLCFGCHIRTPTEKDVANAAPLIEALRLPPLERATFFATTRQFDRALAEWTSALSTPPKNDVEAFEQAQAVRLALLVAVQGKDDPRATISLLEKYQGRADLPGFMTRLMRYWLTEARAWQREAFESSKKTPAELVARARALVDSTGISKSPAPDDARLVSHLRAAGYLQEALRRDPTGPLRGEALLLLGVLSAAATDPALWRLEWLTLESCIRENGKKPLARQCAERLTERTWFTYSSGGRAELPGDVGQKLGELNALVR